MSISLPRTPAHDALAVRPRPRADAGQFRPDIEGLRAVAVLLVVLYHAKLAGVTGGYVGVDVFFVISGFLITRQLFETQQRRGRVHLTDFYMRRMKRLLPAALVVTLAVLGAARVWSSTTAAKDIARDAVYTALYGMNFHLAADGTSYLNASKAPSPLQHFWSLAVEEQFYIVLPLLILALAVIHARLQRRVLLALVGLGSVASFYLCLVLTKSSLSVAYFSIGTRAWELGVGSLLALLAPRLAKLPAGLAVAGSWAGVGLIGYAGFVFTDSTSFPGTAAAIPIGGAALIVACGCRGKTRWGAELLLSRWIAQLLGKISYSWYLWHWPVLVFAPVIFGHPLGVSWRLQAVFVSLLLAVASYFHVELPVRRLKLRHPAWVITGPTLAGLTTAIALLFASTLPTLVGTGSAAEAAALTTSDVAVVQQELAKALTTTVAPSNLTPDLASAAKDFPHVRDCIAQYDDVALPTDCVFGDPQGRKTVALFGDSHATHWLGAFDRAAAGAGWKLLVRAKAACPVADVSYVDDHFKRPYVECDQWRRDAVADVVKAKPDLIVVSQADGTPETKVTDAAFAEGTAKTLRALGAGGARLALLSDIPQPYEPLECVAAHLENLTKCTTTSTAGEERWSMRRGLVADAARRAGARVVETNEWLCRGDRCPPIVGNMLVYQDSGGHLTNTYSTWLAPVVRPLLDGSNGDSPTATPALEDGLSTVAVPANLTPKLDKATTDVPGDNGCFLGYAPTAQGPCEFGDPAGAKTAVLFGDSHAEQWFGALDAAAKKNHWRLIDWTKAACPIGNVPSIVPGLNRPYAECDTWRAATVRRVAALHPDLIIAGQSDATRGDYDDQLWAKATADTLLQMSGGGAVILLQDNPYAPADPVGCLSSHLDDARACTYPLAKAYYYAKPQRRPTVAAVAREAGFNVVDTSEWTCGVDRCPVIVGNMLVYRDLGHVTNTFATWLAPIVEHLLPKA